MNKNRQILAVGCIVAILLSIWAFHRESNSLQEAEVEPARSLSRRSAPSTSGGANSGMAHGRSATQREQLIKSYQLLWQDLEERNASIEDRAELARKTAREFMFSNEMVDIFSFLIGRRISTGRLTLVDQLALLFHSDMASGARVSLLNHLDNLKEFPNAINIFEQAGVGLSEDDFKIFHTQVYDLNPRYSVAVLRGRNVEKMKTDPLKTLESVLSHSRATGSSERSLETDLIRMLNTMPVGRDFEYQSMAALFSDHFTDNPRVLRLVQKKIYYNWAVVDAESAYAQWKSHDGMDDTLRELTEGAIKEKSFEDASLWLFGLTEPKEQATAYTAAATQWATTDPTQAIFLANQIQDSNLREKAISSVEGVLTEMRMTPEER